MNIFDQRVPRFIPTAIDLNDYSVPCTECPKTMPFVDSCSNCSKTMPKVSSVACHNRKALRNPVHDNTRPGRVVGAVDLVGSTLSLSWADYTRVPVAKVTENFDVWETELASDIDKEFVLTGIKEGFSLVDLEVSGDCTYRRNYRSTLCENKQKVEQRLIEEIESGHYVVSPVPMLKTSALGAVPKGSDDVRVIHDLSRPDGGLNKFAQGTSVTYVTIDDAVKFISPSSYLAKLDLKSAYRSIPIHESCYQYTGIQWKFAGEQNATNLFDCRLPFGAAISCVIFQRVTDAIARIM
jgi:hypothetical protein